MSDETRSLEEQEYEELFASVDAPATMRRWDRAGADASAAARAPARWLRRSRLDVRGRYLPIAVAAAISLLVGTAGATVGLHGRLGGGTAAGTPGTPPARSGAAMAYDPAGHLTLLFGGQGIDGRNLGDTWAWDGSSWRQLHPATSPPARTRAQMAWDGDRDRMVLFGGEAEGSSNVLPAIACVPQQPCPPSVIPVSPLTDTWTWDGSTWQQAHPAHHPAFGLAQGMVDDPASHQVVLVGIGPSALAPGDGSPTAVSNPPAVDCGAGQCSVSCSSWTSSGPGGSVSGGGGCDAAPATFGCPTPDPSGAGSCTSFTVSATSSVVAPSTPACPPPTTPPNGVTTMCSGPFAFGGAGRPAAAGAAQSPVPQPLPCTKAGPPAGACAQTVATATFGWNGSDWGALTPLLAGYTWQSGDTRLAQDPQSGRPLALTELWRVACPASAAVGAAGNDAASLCLACPPVVKCALAGSGGSTAVGSAPSSVARTPLLCTAAGCAGVTISYSAVESRFDGSWHNTPVSGPLSQTVGPDSVVLSGLASDTSDASVVAIFSSNHSAQTWRFDGHQWSQLPAAGTPYLLDASIAEDPHGLVLFGGQTFGSQQPSNATYTWDGHSWALHGAAPAAGAATPTAIPPAVSAAAQATSTSEPPQQSTSSSSASVTPGPATPVPTPTPTPTPG